MVKGKKKATTTTERATEDTTTADAARARGTALVNAAREALDEGRIQGSKHRRVQELVTLLDMENATVDDTWAAIDSRRTEERKDRGAYYVPGTFIVFEGKPCHPTKTVERNGANIPAPAEPLIPAKASDDELDAYEAEHIEKLQAELDSLVDDLGL